MAGTMSREDLIADLRAGLNDARTVFEGTATKRGYGELELGEEDGDDTGAGDDVTAAYARMLDLAAGDFARYRPRVMSASLQLKPRTALYVAPDDLYRFYRTAWGDGNLLQPWEPGYGLVQKPRVEVVETNSDDGTPVRQLQFSPAPSIDQLAFLGSTFRYLYYAHHVIGDRASATTIRSEDRDLLLLRAKAEAMREIATRDSFKPVQLRDGLNSGPKNRQPAALFSLYMTEFESRMMQRVVA